MTAHTSKDFEQELRTQRERLATMGARAQEQIALAMKALADRDDELARQAVSTAERRQWQSECNLRVLFANAGE